MTQRHVLFCVTVVAALMLSVALFSCSSTQQDPSTSTAKVERLHPVKPVAPPALDATKPADYPGLHNVVTFAENVYSGSLPEGDAGYDVVAGFGCLTIIDVDGAAPDVERAEVRGMRYIHLPIGYDGFDEERKVELAQALNEGLKVGPVYFHCHHGMHRSASATASAAEALGLITPETGLAKMKVAGTAPNYKGLFRCAAESTPLPATTLDAPHAAFASLELPKGLTKGMVEIDEMNDNLKAAEKAGWKAPKDHPDLIPVDQSDRIVAVMNALAMTDAAAKKPAGFVAAMRSAQAHAQEVSDALRAGGEATAVSAKFKVLAQSCRDCHSKFRD